MTTRMTSLEFIGQRKRPFTIIDPGTGTQVYVDLPAATTISVSAEGAQALVKEAPELWRSVESKPIPRDTTSSKD